MGVDCTRVKKALQKRIQETGSGFKFVNELVEATILQAAENVAPMSTERIQSPSSINERATSTSIGSSISNQSIPSQPQVPLTESHPRLTHEETNTLTSELSNTLAFSNQAGATDRNQPSNSNSRACTSAPGTLQTNTQTIAAGGAAVAHQHVVKNKNTTEQSEDLELENRRLKDQRTCKICMDREIGVVFLPCGHLISCVQCAPALKDCPLCRQPIHGTVKTYMS